MSANALAASISVLLDAETPAEKTPDNRATNATVAVDFLNKFIKYVYK